MLKKAVVLSALVVMCLCLTAGCMRQAQLQNPKGIPVKSAIGQSLTDAQVKQAIFAGAKQKGWVARELSPGLITASLAVRTHLAEVEIPYNGSSYSIIYKSSTNLDYKAKDQTIHNQYNNWVNYLRLAIDAQLAEMK